MSFDTKFRKWFIQWRIPPFDHFIGMVSLDAPVQSKWWKVGPIVFGWRQLPIHSARTVVDKFGGITRGR